MPTYPHVLGLGNRLDATFMGIECRREDKFIPGVCPDDLTNPALVEWVLR